MTKVVLDIAEDDHLSLASIAESRGETVTALLTEAARMLLAEDQAFRRAVETGIAEADAGQLIDHSEIVAHARARRA